LLISADSDAAREKLASMDKTVVQLAAKYLKWLKVAGWVAAVIVAIQVALVALNAVMAVSKIIMGAYSIVMGLAAAAGAVNLKVIAGNTVAAIAYRSAVTLATAAQWAWNIAMTASPIGLIILGITLLIGLLASVVAYWHEWGAAVSMFLGPIGLMIGFFRTLYDRWEMLKKALTTDGIIGAFKALGKVILESVLAPFQQFYEMLSKIPGLGDLSKVALIIEKYREGLYDDEKDPKPAILSPTAQQQDSVRDMIKDVLVGIEIKNKTGLPATVTSNNNANIMQYPSSSFENF
jgi:hypothetical protein